MCLRFADVFPLEQCAACFARPVERLVAVHSLCHEREPAIGEASRLYAELVSRGLRTICFAKSRRSAELIHRFTSERVDAATAKRLAPYRAGYTPEQRREIETLKTHVRALEALHTYRAGTAHCLPPHAS